MSIRSSKLTGPSPDTGHRLRANRDVLADEAGDTVGHILVGEQRVVMSRRSAHEVRSGHGGGA
jgi:hypothetical protein